VRSGATGAPAEGSGGGAPASLGVPEPVVPEPVDPVSLEVDDPESVEPEPLASVLD
jgi:hypothetical protein